MCVCVIQAEAQMLCNNCNHPHRKTHSTLPFAAPALSCLSTSSGSSMFSLFSSAWQSPQDLQRVPHTTHQTHNIWSVLQKNGYSRTGNKASARCARASPRASCGGDRSREIRKDASLQKHGNTHIVRPLSMVGAAPEICTAASGLPTPSPGGSAAARTAHNIARRRGGWC